MKKYSFDKTQSEKIWGENYRCMLCGSNHRLELHHITHKRNNAKSIYNSIHLCHNCHKKYGSSSADDIKKHLNISVQFINWRLEYLRKNDLMFNEKKFWIEDDKKFVKEFWNYYTDKNKEILKKILWN